MFRNLLLKGAALDLSDWEKERKPPPEPTPTTFPNYQETITRNWGPENPAPDFHGLFSKILKPSDILQEHFEALNIDVLSPCSFAELLPSASDGSSFVPDLSSAPQTDETSSPQATDSANVKRKDLNQRLTELRTDNSDAFQIINGTISPTTRGLRLTFMRKFFESLQEMAYYWDCSLDEYIQRNDAEEDREDGAKRQRTDDRSFMALNDSRVNSSSDDSFSEPSTEGYWRRDLPISAEKAVPSTEILGKHKALVDPAVSYKGRRGSSGRYMPERFRADVVKGFMEGVAWPFNTTIAQPRMASLVQFGTLRVPAKQNAAIYCLPPEISRVRQGRLEGPLLGIQVRGEIDFASDTGISKELKARLDLLSEIGALLQLAQERQRQGKIEEKPGAGKWWTTRPRWGGSIDPEVKGIANGVDALSRTERARVSDDNDEKPVRSHFRSRRPPTPATQWKEVKCGSGYWDPRTEYKAIGKDANSDYDEIFLVSSLNHHISVLKLTIHEAYLDTLLTGSMPRRLPADPSWCKPKLRRSKWHDLFDIDQRIELFHGLWGVVSYLLRNRSSKDMSE